MTLSQNDTRAIRQALSEVRRKAEQAEQAPDLDATIAALTEVWAANTRAMLTLRTIRDEVRERANQDVAA